jgi:hypothetical protein
MNILTENRNKNLLKAEFSETAQVLKKAKQRQ